MRDGGSGHVEAEEWAGLGDGQKTFIVKLIARPVKTDLVKPETLKDALRKIYTETVLSRVVNVDVRAKVRHLPLAPPPRPCTCARARACVLLLTSLHRRGPTGI